MYKRQVLPPAIMLMVLLMMVSVGLVVGVMEQITPKGAYSCLLYTSTPAASLRAWTSLPPLRTATLLQVWCWAAALP